MFFEWPVRTHERRRSNGTELNSLCPASHNPLTLWSVLWANGPMAAFYGNMDMGGRVAHITPDGHVLITHYPPAAPCCPRVHSPVTDRA